MLDSERAASQSQPLKRFHYRYVAVDLAQKAVDLVPTRSQAYAAMLCEATHWVLARDPAAAVPLYRRYLKTGPHVAWGRDFGQTCPAPDFVGAAKRAHAERIAHYRHLARRAAPYAAGGAIALGLLLVAIWLRRRRRA